MDNSDAKSAENQQTEQVCSFFRKPVNKKNIRKRTVDNEDNEDDSNNEGSLMHVQKKTMKPDNKLFFSSGSSKSSASTEPNEESEKHGFILSLPKRFKFNMIAKQLRLWRLRLIFRKMLVPFVKELSSKRRRVSRVRELAQGMQNYTRESIITKIIKPDPSSPDKLSFS
ncbi:unnamed protein product [Lathyrus oleraceus]